MLQHDTGRRQAQAVAVRLETFLGALVDELDRLLDRRLVRTLLLALKAIVQFRNTSCGLLLSELGGHVLSPEKAPAGTKRLGNLLRSPRWSHTLLERFLWRRAEEALADLEEAERTALAVWDESVLEKPESLALEGLGPVRSSRAARLKRIKPGYFSPPGGVVFVPGMHWLTVMVLGMQGPPALAAMRWWTGRGRLASSRIAESLRLLHECARRWGRQVVHVFDRGYAGAVWLKELEAESARFILRWPSRYRLADDRGTRPAWQVTRGRRSVDHRLTLDARRRCHRRTGILYTPVRHPDLEGQLWLVVSRPGNGLKPMYLLTNEPVASPDEAWRVVLAYNRRWQVEMCYRSCKTDLAMQSPRLWSWENRLKLLCMVSIVYAFLLSMLSPDSRPLVQAIFRRWRHRTGNHSREAAVPISRLRAALSTLWLTHPPAFTILSQNPG